MAVLLARIRLPLQYLGFVGCVVGIAIMALSGLAVPLLGGVGGWVVAVSVALVVLAVVLSFASPTAGGAALRLASPVRGRWQAMNSPTSKIPSHGTHAYAQTYAVDLVYAPEGVEKPEFGRADSAFLPPERFPGFGQPIYAPADATVVCAVNDVRDHRSRSSWLAYFWFFIEAIPRELRATRGVLGNHLVLRLGDGSHFVLAHLRRGSLRVKVGDQVQTSDLLAECGNTGNSTEPHLHCQRQDRASAFIAAGLPWTVEPGGIPANGSYLET